MHLENEQFLCIVNLQIMHITEPLYRNPYWPTCPFIQITQGCTHNSCKLKHPTHKSALRTPLELVPLAENFNYNRDKC